MDTNKLDTVEEISAYVTHGLNTPLTYLKANLELMGYDIKSMPSSTIRNELMVSKKKISKAIREMQEVINTVHSITQNSSIKK